MSSFAHVEYEENGKLNSIFGFRLSQLKTRDLKRHYLEITESHKRHLSNLVNMLFDPDSSTSYAIRTVIKPNSSHNQQRTVAIAFLVRITSESVTQLENDISSIGNAIKLILGGAFTDYRWELLSDLHSLTAFLDPLDWKKAFFAEFRRREEVVLLETMLPKHKSLGFMPKFDDASQDVELNSIYFIHPFDPPTLGFERLIKSMLHYDNDLVFTAILSPTSLSKSEYEFMGKQISMCEGILRTNSDATRVNFNRAHTLNEVLLRQLLTLQDAPFIMTFTVSSEQPIDPVLLEYIGMSITESVGHGISTDQPVHNYSFHAGGYDVVVPIKPKDIELCENNMRKLLQHPWRHVPDNKEAKRFRFLFDGNEAISAFYLPINGEQDLPGIDTFIVDSQPVPGELYDHHLKGNSDVSLGYNQYLNSRQDVIIPETVRRDHTYIIGEAAKGRLELLKSMILSDMESHQGLVVLDPTGNFYQDLLNMIPKERAQDVVLFDVSDENFPVGFNFLEVNQQLDVEIIAKSILTVLKRFINENVAITSSDAAGISFFQHVYNNLLLSASDESNPGTLIEFFSIFQSKDFWKRWLPLKWSNDQLENWVKSKLPQIDYSLTDREGNSFGEVFSLKLSDFFNDERIRVILGQQASTINLSEIIQQKKILLINLSQSLLGEANSSLLGTLLLVKILNVRKRIVKECPDLLKKSPFYIYLNEFHKFALENFSLMLEEAKNLGLSIVMTNQYIRQIPDIKTLKSIFCTIGTLVSFHLEMDDAQFIENQFFPQYNAFDINRLSNFNAIIRNMIDGQKLRPYDINVSLNTSHCQFATRNDIIESSREKYSSPQKLAEFIVKSTLSYQRNKIYNYYWEKDGTPEHEKLLYVNLSNLLLPRINNDNESKRLIADWDDGFKSQMVHYLTNIEKTSRAKVSQYLFELEELESEGRIFSEIAISKLTEFFPEEISRNIIGIYNHLKKDLFENWLQDLSRMITLPEDNKTMDDIKEDCLQDLWVTAENKTITLWKDKHSIAKFANKWNS